MRPTVARHERPQRSVESQLDDFLDSDHVSVLVDLRHSLHGSFVQRLTSVSESVAIPVVVLESRRGRRPGIECLGCLTATDTHFPLASPDEQRGGRVDDEVDERVQRASVAIDTIDCMEADKCSTGLALRIAR